MDDRGEDQAAIAAQAPLREIMRLRAARDRWRDLAVRLSKGMAAVHALADHEPGCHPEWGGCACGFSANTQTVQNLLVEIDGLDGDE